MKCAHLLSLVIAVAITTPVPAGIPVIDAGNLTQNVISAVEEVAQTLKQVEQYTAQLRELETQYQQYATQIQQYENMVQNTVAPAAYLWNQAQSVMTQLRGATDTLAYYKNQVGSVDGYLAKFQDVNYYRNSPCYNATGCTTEEMETLNRDAATLSSQARKKANDAMFKGLDQQQEALVSDAARLGQLQRQASTATGQMQAIGYAAQIAGEQANQLMQIRGLLVAQQNAIATKMQADADEEARMKAADEKALSGEYTPSMRKAY